MSKKNVLIWAEKVFGLVIFEPSISANKLYQNILEIFETSGRHLASSQSRDMKYALSAYVDEKIRYSDWIEKSSWNEITLQGTLFAEQLAGEGFFERLQKLLQNPKENIELLELYYICLQLGFEGKYRIHEAETLPKLTADLFNIIENTRSQCEKSLPVKTKKTNIYRRLFKHILTKKILFGLFLIIYLGFFFVMQNALQKNTAEMHSYLSLLSKQRAT